MPVLDWEKPRRKIPVEEWKKISADGAPPGVYVPNMSEEDRLKWKAKIFGGKDPRVEIRKTFHWSNNKPWREGGVNYGSQALIVVRLTEGDEPQVLISANGKIAMTLQESEQLQMAINEARLALQQ